jgi:hypothetical protein
MISNDDETIVSMPKSSVPEEEFSVHWQALL